MNRRAALLVMALLPAALGLGCAAVRTPIPGLQPAELPRQDQWWARQATVRVQQDVLFRFGSRSLAMIGVLQADFRPAGQRRARLVALNEFGLTLFDLEVREADSELHSALPDLTRIPGFQELVASCLRRMLVWDAPATAWTAPGGDAKDVSFYAEPVQGSLRLVFSGPERDLTSQDKDTDGEDWQAVYGEYQDGTPLGRFPQRIRYEDRRAGYSLELRNRSVRSVP